MKKLGLVLLLLVAVGSVYAVSTTLTPAIQSLCSQLKLLLPVVAMLMVIVAGVIYASGQIMGAETRARANVWATAALTGALIALLIWAVAPGVLGSLTPAGITLENEC